MDLVLLLCPHFFPAETSFLPEQEAGLSRILDQTHCPPAGMGYFPAGAAPGVSGPSQTGGKTSRKPHARTHTLHSWLTPPLQRGWQSCISPNTPADVQEGHPKPLRGQAAARSEARKCQCLPMEGLGTSYPGEASLQVLPPGPTLSCLDQFRCGLTSRQEGELDGLFGPFLPWDFRQTLTSGE